MKTPEGKFIGTVKVGEKGQIVIPKGARQLFNMEPGDVLLLMADVERGIALVRNDSFLDFASAVFEAQKSSAQTSEEDSSEK